MARTRKRSRKLSNSGSTSNFQQESPKKDVAQRSLRSRVVKVPSIPIKHRKGRKPVHEPVEVAKNRTYSLSPVQCNEKTEMSMAILKTPVASSTCLINETISFADSTLNDENVDPASDNEQSIIEKEKKSAEKHIVKLAFRNTRSRMTSPAVNLTPKQMVAIGKKTLMNGLLKKPVIYLNKIDLNSIATPENIRKHRKLNKNAEVQTNFPASSVKIMKKTTFVLNNTPTNQSNADVKVQVIKTPFAKDSAIKLKNSTTFKLNDTPNIGSAESPMKQPVTETASAKETLINGLLKKPLNHLNRIELNSIATPENIGKRRKLNKKAEIQTNFPACSVKIMKKTTFDLNNTPTVQSNADVKVQVIKIPFAKGPVNKLKKSTTFLINGTLNHSNVESPVKEPAPKSPISKGENIPRILRKPSMNVSSVNSAHKEQLKAKTVLTPAKVQLPKTKKADTASDLKKDTTFEINEPNLNTQQEKVQNKGGTTVNLNLTKIVSAKEHATPSKLQKNVPKQLKTAVATPAKTPMTKTPLTNGSFTPKQQEGTGQKSAFRTKLPNFAEMHKTNFDRMESLLDHAQRKANHARDLLNSRALTSNDTNDSGVTNRAYNRFGFKSTKLTDIRRSLEIQEIKIQNPAILNRHAKYIQMAKKSVVKTETSSNKCRSILKGVRLNKRFDLQMKYRDCN